MVATSLELHLLELVGITMAQPIPLAHCSSHRRFVAFHLKLLFLPTKQPKFSTPKPQVQQPQQTVIDVQHFQQNVVSQEISMMTDADLLFIGLSFVGFDRARQAQSGQARNFERFSAHFGWEPKVLNLVFYLCKEKSYSQRKERVV